MAASALPGMIDPTKQAEYPIFLGDRLAGKADKSRSQLVNIQYNYKTKSTSSQQRSVITRSPHSRDHFNLTITDKAPSAEQNILIYSYQGSVDPTQSASESHEHNLVLIFDPGRKAFVLEPVTTQVNFNLRSAPSKTQKLVVAQYPQLRTLQEDEHGSGDDRGTDNTSGNDDGPPDEDNPYDFRHFLPKGKENQDDENKLASRNATPEPYIAVSKTSTPVIAAARPALSPRPPPKAQANPLRQKKLASDTARHQNAAPLKPRPRSPLILPEKSENRSRDTKSRTEQQAPEEIVFETTKSSPSDAGTGAVSSQRTAPSPGSNIIIDGDLIIDMGSPPPTRPFKVNPAHFSSNNTPANDDDEDNGDEDIEALRLPSPVPTAQRSEPTSGFHADGGQMYGAGEEPEDEDDLLAAEMEAAFEEEARSHQMQPQIHSHQYIQSDDESEVSEEE